MKGVFFLEAMYPVDEWEKNMFLAYKALVDPDTMYMHEATIELDKKQFIKSMGKEVANQSNNKNLSIINLS